MNLKINIEEYSYFFSTDIESLLNLIDICSTDKSQKNTVYSKRFDTFLGKL